MGTAGWIAIGLLVLIGLWLIMTYNGLVSLRQRCRQAFSDIDVQLKQRHDLVPNLVETVRSATARPICGLALSSARPVCGLGNHRSREV